MAVAVHSKKLNRITNITALLLLVAFCLLELVMFRQSRLFREYAVAFLSIQWLLLACFTLWCGTFLFLAFRWKDLPLIGLLIIAIAAYFLGTAEWLGRDVLVLLFGLTLGKGTQFLLKSGKRIVETGNQLNAEDRALSIEFRNLNSELQIFLDGLVVMLALASWWHLDMTDNYYSGPRWMGLWDNPNIYGMLMGAGVMLAIGLLPQNLKSEKHKTASGESGKWKLFFAIIKFASGNMQSTILLVAVALMGVGLMMSYSRGAWLGTTIGLLYLAWAYGKFKWRLVLTVIAVAATAVVFFWGSTLDSAPWYVKRADLGRPSAQNRTAAWRAGLKIMRDHPLGVGWNNAVKIYGEKYSPPEGGPGALTTNDYLMLGTELGIAALICFVAYCALALRGKCRIENETGRIQAACRAGAIVLLVAFWFDGGLFNLPTAAVFWVLLELGAARGGKVDRRELMVDRPKT